LDLSRIEAGQITINPRAVALSPLIAEVCDSLRPLATAKQIDLAAEAAADLTVMADRDRLTQILLNLTGNALQFTPSGARAAGRAGDQVRIQVADNGPGMNPREQARIFERFYQVPVGDSGRTVGTGLGLSITKSLVELHGGGIAVESAPGTGSTFTVSLPVA